MLLQVQVLHLPRKVPLRKVLSPRVTIAFRAKLPLHVMYANDVPVC
jgi:hypothetical protein